MENTRVGNFSSSEIWKLMKEGRGGGFGAPALTYIEEKKMEMRLGRPLNNETNAKMTNWGTFLEKRAFDLLGLEYRLESKERLKHDIIEHWTGAPDFIGDDFTGDIKCPYTLKSFCTSVDAMLQGWESFKEAQEAYYWQLISNSILTGKKFIEIVVYVPYLSELPAIREMANNYDGDQNKIAFLNWANDDDLPYLVDGGYYKNLNTLRWEASEKDKKALTDKVIEAGILLKK